MPDEMQNPRAQRANPDIRLSRVASRQKGVVCAADVRRARLSKDALRRRVASERMHPMFPGTWAWGHRAVTREAWFLAGVLSAGPDARLAAASACQLYGVLDRRIGRVHVLSARRSPSSPRLRVHHARELPRMRRVAGIPVVPVEDALLGLAADRAVSDRDVRRAVRQAQVLKLTTHATLARHARGCKGRRGVERLRRIVGDRPAPTRSELEDAALALLRRYGLDPRCNVLVDGYEADVVVDGVIVELDSETFHDNPLSAEDDGRKQMHWESRGHRIERLTWDDIHVTPVATIRRVRRASRATRSSPPPA